MLQPQAPSNLTAAKSRSPTPRAIYYQRALEIGLALEDAQLVDASLQAISDGKALDTKPGTATPASDALLGAIGELLKNGSFAALVGEDLCATARVAYLELAMKTDRASLALSLFRDLVTQCVLSKKSFGPDEQDAARHCILCARDAVTRDSEPQFAGILSTVFEHAPREFVEGPFADLFEGPLELIGPATLRVLLDQHDRPGRFPVLIAHIFEALGKEAAAVVPEITKRIRRAPAEKVGPLLRLLAGIGPKARNGLREVGPNLRGRGPQARRAFQAALKHCEGKVNL